MLVCSCENNSITLKNFTTDEELDTDKADDFITHMLYFGWEEEISVILILSAFLVPNNLDENLTKLGLVV